MSGGAKRYQEDAMNKITALTLAAALAGGAALTLPSSRAQAAPVGVQVGVLGAGSPVVDQVQYRRRVVRRRGGGDAALAAGLIGAAVIGGAIIAQSQRDREYERSYYYGQPQGYDYYGQPQGYYANPYAQPAYTPPRRRYVDPGYYEQREYGYPHYRHHRSVRDPAGGGRMNTGP
jgi:hypothetical protein